MRASSVLRSAVVVQPDLRSADVYVLASQAASFSACLLPTGLGVHIEVSEGGGTRELDVPMQLPPAYFSDPNPTPPDPPVLFACGGLLVWLSVVHTVNTIRGLEPLSLEPFVDHEFLCNELSN